METNLSVEKAIDTINGMKMRSQIKERITTVCNDCCCYENITKIGERK